MGEWDEEEGGGESEGEPEGWEEQHQYQGRPLRQLLLEKGVDKEGGEERSSGNGSEEKVRAGRTTTKARGGIRAMGALAAAANHHKNSFIDRCSWKVWKCILNIRGVIVAGR